MANRIPTILARLFSLGLCISILLGEAGCTRGQLKNTKIPAASQQSSSTHSPVEQSDGTQSNTADVQAGNVVITFTAYEFERAMFEPLMAQFHDQNPTITVNFVPLPLSFGDSAESYYRTLASTADTSLILGRSSQMGSYFRDLQPQIDTDADFRQEDFWPDGLSACQDEQGRTLGVPVNLFMSGVFYDEQAFQAAGLPLPQPGWTWDDFRKATAALASQDASGIRYGFADPTYASVVSPLLSDHFLNMDGDIDSQSLANELQWYVDLAKQGALYPMQGTAGGEANQQAEERWKAMFQGSRPPAMWFGRLQDPIPGLAGISEDTDPARLLAITRFGFAPFPVASADASAKTTPITAQCVAMSAGTQYPQAAWKWAKFLTEQRLLHDASQISEKLIIPARSSVAEASGFWANLPAGLELPVREGLAHGWYKGLYAISEVVVNSALEQAAVEGKDLSQALAEAKIELAAKRSQAAPAPSPVVIATSQDANGSASGIPLIRFYSGDTDAQEIQTLKDIVDRFNREHKDQFSVSLITSYSFPENQGYFESLAHDFDCFVAQVDPMGAVASGVVLDLNGFLDGEPTAFRQDYDTALLDRSRYEGGLYDLPLVVQPAVMAYNADLLASRSLPLPSNDWSYEDFVGQITAIPKLNGAEKIYGILSESQAVDVPGMLLAGRNVQWLDVSGSTPLARLNTPEMANSLIWLSGLYRSGAIFPSAAGEGWWTSITKGIQSGQIAYWTVLAGQQNSLYFEGQKPSFRVGIVPLPAVSSNVAFDAGIERGLYIASRSSNAPACWDWARYLSEQPVSWYGVPARTSVSALPTWESSVGLENAAIYRQALARLQGMRMEGAWKIMVLPLNSWQSEVEIGARNGEDVQQLLATAQQKAEIYQACLGQAGIEKMKEAELRGIVTNCAKRADPAW